MLTWNDIFYLLLNAFRIYIMYRLIGLFFKSEDKKRCLFYGYTIFFLLNSYAYIFIDHDIVNLAINLLSLIITVAWGYRDNLIRKILAIVLSLGTNLLAENLAWIIFVKEKSEYMISYGFFFSVFIFFILEFIIEKTIRLYKGFEISVYKNILLLFISIGNAFIANVLIEGFYEHVPLLVIALCILIGINISVFYIYEKILNDYAIDKEKEIYEMQLVMYQKQLKMMREANDAFQLMKHDMKHHMMMVLNYIKKEKNEKALEYLLKMNDFISSKDQYVDTGNESIDSILNYNIDKINRIGGTINTDIKVAEGMPIDDFDLNIILSNLLLNAYEAIQRCDKKSVEVFIEYNRGIIRIKILNTYDGTIIERKGQLISNKKEDNHGIGLVSVRKTVEKYGGDINITYTGSTFCVKIFFYV